MDKFLIRKTSKDDASDKMVSESGDTLIGDEDDEKHSGPASSKNGDEIDDDCSPKNKKRGRPSNVSKTQNGSAGSDGDESNEEIIPKKKGRGTPSKVSKSPRGLTGSNGDERNENEVPKSSNIPERRNKTDGRRKNTGKPKGGTIKKKKNNDDDDDNSDDEDFDPVKVIAIDSEDESNADYAKSDDDDDDDEYRLGDDDGTQKKKKPDTTKVTKSPKDGRPTKKISKSPRIKTPKSAKKGKLGGMTLEQHRRRLGDAVKSKLSMEKYCMKASCHFTVDNFDIEVFKQLVEPHAHVTPKTFDEKTPVVVALIKGANAAGEIFGKSKIKGGNRYDQREVRLAELVFFPSTKILRAWWVMYDY